MRLRTFTHHFLEITYFYYRMTSISFCKLSRFPKCHVLLSFFFEGENGVIIQLYVDMIWCFKEVIFHTYCFHILGYFSFSLNYIHNCQA